MDLRLAFSCETVWSLPRALVLVLWEGVRGRRVEAAASDRGNRHIAATENLE